MPPFGFLGSSNLKKQDFSPGLGLTEPFLISGEDLSPNVELKKDTGIIEQGSGMGNFDASLL